MSAPKLLREWACKLQLVFPRESGYQEVIDLIDQIRPLGPDGKHGDRHTPYCGCEDGPVTIPAGQLCGEHIELRIRWGDPGGGDGQSDGYGDGYLASVKHHYTGVVEVETADYPGELWAARDGALSPFTPVTVWPAGGE